MMKLLSILGSWAKENNHRRTYVVVNRLAKLLLSPEERRRKEQKAYEEFMLYGPFGREVYEAQQRYDKSRREVELMVSLIDWRLGGY